MSPTAIVAYLALFATVGFLFVLTSLILGWFLRASAPTQQKLETYECGEPTIGPGSVQFDLRFYVMALVFLIFEVEVAFFFPPAVVFGKAVHALAPPEKSVQEIGTIFEGIEQVAAAGVPDGKTILSPFSSLALASMIDLGVFFAVLLVGFAFVWSRGDLDWVRAVSHPAVNVERGDT